MSESDQHERRRHFRGKPRPGRTVGLRYERVGDGGQTRTAVTRNIGVGGAFILTAEPEPVGALLRLAVHVPTSDRPIDVLAEVRWAQAPEIDPSCAGMGVKFQDLEVDQLLELNEYFASLTGAGGELDDDEA